MDKRVIFLLWATAATPFAQAVTPQEMVVGYAAQAGVAVEALDPAAGEALFRRGGAGDKQCTGCHTDDPRTPGKTRVGKRIEPMAPAINAARFTDAAKTEKWFGRNCKDVLSRECTPLEKASVIVWLSRLNREEK